MTAASYGFYQNRDRRQCSGLAIHRANSQGAARQLSNPIKGITEPTRERMQGATSDCQSGVTQVFAALAQGAPKPAALKEKERLP